MNRFSRALVLLALPSLALAQPFPLVDTHAHFESLPYKDFAASEKSALAAMTQWNIGMSLLMPPPRATLDPKTNYDIEELLPAIKANPGRLAALGGAGSLTIMLHNTSPEAVNDAVRQSFRQRAMEIIALGAVGFGEIPIQHLSLPNMGPRHAYENVPADHPLLLLLADIAAENDVPIDIHFDMVPNDMPLPPPLKSPPNPPKLQGNLPAFERLLTHNPKTRIVWAHVGFEPIRTRGPDIVRQLLTAHPNLYMSFRLGRTGPHPTMAMAADGKLKPEWMALLQAFPDRFMLGSDSFYAGAGVSRGATAEGMENLRALVDQLPAELGRQLARDNATRVYRLKVTTGQ